MNIADRLREQARLLPDKAAIIQLKGRRAGRAPQATTFRQLDQLVDELAHGLHARGIRVGSRVILMLRPGVEFFAYSFALMRMGAVPVLIDPGMGRSRMADCLRSTKAEAFVGIPLAHVFRLLHGGAFRTVKLAISVGRRLLWSGLKHQDIRQAGQGKGPFQHEAAPQDQAAILFTTGSTGPPKGVVYTHSIFEQQVCYLNEVYGYSPDEIDLPTFPLFALFDAALGMTAVLPDMDFTRPAKVRPDRILGPIQEFGITHMFGSPALLQRVSEAGVRSGARLQTLRRVMTAGAPVRPSILESMRGILGESADIHTPYGATEALPLATIESREILAECRAKTEQGAGTCVGKPLPGLTVRIIRITDEPVPEWQDDLVVALGQTGEISVKGPIATRHYFNNPGADALAKILEADGSHWHRMGDLGWMDELGRLWFCGRKNHRVITPGKVLFTIPVEARFNNHPAVARTALVGVGPKSNQRPVLCVELKRGQKGSWKNIESELRKIAEGEQDLSLIQDFLPKATFPVDIRHNAKIFREQLAVWAGKKLGL